MMKADRTDGRVGSAAAAERRPQRRMALAAILTGGAGLLAAAIGGGRARAATPAAAHGRAGPHLSAEDRLDILAIANSFTTALQDGDVDTLATLFATDGAIDHPAGHGEDREGVRAFFKGFLAYSRGVRLNSVNQIVTANADGTAGLRSALVVVGVSDSRRPGAVTPSIIGHALITDRLKREDGRWVIAKRTVEEVIMSAVEQPDAAQRARWAMQAADRGLAPRRS
jgi:hypothetical protein